MDSYLFDEMLGQEKTHWWWLSRRAIIRSRLNALQLPQDASILEAGCGSGGNLGMLASLGRPLYAFEINDKPRANAVALKLATVEYGALPGPIPFPGLDFDLICLIDVLEHVEDDKASLAALAGRLKPDGVLCVNVPAFQCLFSRHDRLHRHFRRYSKPQLLRMLQDAGFTIEFAGYWNFFLFPAAILARLVDALGFSKGHAIGAKEPPGTINRFLTALVSSERYLLPYMALPFGLSLLVLARKSKQASP